MADLKAYQEFMLRGKFAGGDSAPSTPNTSTSQKDLSTNSSGTKRSKNEMAVFRAFQGRLQEWKDLDSQLETVLGSISNLRDRIWWETRHIDDLADRKTWEYSCFRSTWRYATSLTTDDVHMALTHDMLQHERMLSTCRTLIASMAQTQDGLGRRLDEWLMMQLEAPLTEQGQLSLEQAQGVYVFLAEELYRKQEHVKKVLDSCNDALVKKDAIEKLGNPRSVCRECCAEWSSKDLVLLGLIRQMLLV